MMLFWTSDGMKRRCSNILRHALKYHSDLFHAGWCTDATGFVGNLGDKLEPHGKTFLDLHTLFKWLRQTEADELLVSTHRSQRTNWRPAPITDLLMLSGHFWDWNSHMKTSGTCQQCLKGVYFFNFKSSNSFFSAAISCFCSSIFRSSCACWFWSIWSFTDGPTGPKGTGTPNPKPP